MTFTRRAAFFDLDHTILRGDSGTSWMRFLYRRGEISSFELLRVLYWSFLYKTTAFDMETLARRLVADLAGDLEADLVAKTQYWHDTELRHKIAPAARWAIEAHRRQGDILVLLTASTQYAAEEIARGLAVDHTLCSRLEVRDGVFTGRLDPFCYGRHKVSMAEQLAAEYEVDLTRSCFYSDSYNDLPMLRRVGVPIAVNPDARLRRHARRAGWRIDRWM